MKNKTVVLVLKLHVELAEDYPEALAAVKIKEQMSKETWSIEDRRGDVAISFAVFDAFILSES